jgi:2-keto-4-pentenoate hydratase/2-oxohepta-3-ene-1,7-dioic acid hydratase in catechol pathway
MKIFGVGLNYIDHVYEFGNREIPSEPVIFCKPDTALFRNNTPFYYPPFSNLIHYELEIVIRVGKEGKCIAEKFAHRYIDSIGLGIDFTARDLQNKLKLKGLPWEISKGFNNSALVSEFFPYETIKDTNNINFSLLKNGEVVQKGNSSAMIFKFEKIISYISQFFTIKKGDLIFTGTPKGVGEVKIGDLLEGYWENNKLIHCEIK